MNPPTEVHAGEEKLRRQANIGLAVTVAIIAAIVYFRTADGKGLFESRAAYIDRLEQRERSASLALWYCEEHPSQSCAAKRAELEVIREKLRDVYR
jgi:hypothetical protein